MTGAFSARGDSAVSGDFRLSSANVTYFETFGFVKIPGLFRADVERITAGFEEVFAQAKDIFPMPAENPYHHSDDPRYRDELRLIVPGLIERSPDLRWLRDDARVLGIAESLLGHEFEYAESDGNLFNCDVLWHLDAFDSPVGQKHIKLYFYLDALRSDSGALRMIPGTQNPGSPFTKLLRRDLVDPPKVKSIYGVELDEVPSWSIEVEPGDVIVGDFRTLHGSFRGGTRRRLFTMNFKQTSDVTQPAGA